MTCHSMIYCMWFRIVNDLFFKMNLIEKQQLLTIGTLALNTVLRCLMVISFYSVAPWLFVSCYLFTFFSFRWKFSFSSFLCFVRCTNWAVFSDFFFRWNFCFFLFFASFIHVIHVNTDKFQGWIRNTGQRFRKMINDPYLFIYYIFGRFSFFRKKLNQKCSFNAKLII